MLSDPSALNLRRMRHRTLSLLLPLLVATTPLAAQPRRVESAPSTPTELLTPADLSSTALDRLRDRLDRYVSDGELAGGVLRVHRRGARVFEHAFGQRDVEQGSPMQADAIFRIASQTKAIVSTAVLMLQERGELLISDPLSKYLPEFTDLEVAVPTDPAEPGGAYETVPAERPITLRDLLTHTAGVGYGYGPGGSAWREAEIAGWYFADRDEPVRETIRRMSALPLQAQPGKAFVYGYSTDILGAVVEEVSGQPLDRFLAEQILDPLGMEDTHFFLPAEKRDRLATVYSATGAGFERAPDEGTMVAQGHYADGPKQSFSGGAGLLSTAADYARFLEMMRRGGELDGARILSPSSVRLMRANHVGDLFTGPGTGFGLGFAVLEDLGARGTPGSAGEYGWGGAYHSSYWVDPAEGLVVVYLTQLIPAGDIDDHQTIRALIYAALR